MFHIYSAGYDIIIINLKRNNNQGITNLRLPLNTIGLFGNSKIYILFGENGRQLSVLSSSFY